MATTLLLWPDKSGEDQESGEKERLDAAAGTPVRPKSRKGGKQAANAPKKQPQRGLGVAQLERLRAQELRRKMLADAGLPYGQLGPAPMPPPGIGPLQYAFPFGADGRSGCAGAAAFTAPRLTANSQHPAGAGFCEFPSAASGMQRYRIVGGGGRVPALLEGSDRIFTDPRFQNAFPAGTPEKAKELPSNQNVLCWSDQCDTCNKRTRPQCSQIYGFFGGGRQQGGSRADCCDLLRLGLWNPGASDLERAGLETTMVKCGERHGDFSMLSDEGITERKGKDVVREYEFFPAKVGGISVEDSEMAMAELPSASVPIASSSRHDSLDLSLCLSSYSC